MSGKAIDQPLKRRIIDPPVEFARLLGRHAARELHDAAVGSVSKAHTDRDEGLTGDPEIRE